MNDSTDDSSRHSDFVVGTDVEISVFVNESLNVYNSVYALYTVAVNIAQSSEASFFSDLSQIHGRVCSRFRFILFKAQCQGI